LPKDWRGRDKIFSGKHTLGENRFAESWMAGRRSFLPRLFCSLGLEAGKGFITGLIADTNSGLFGLHFVLPRVVPVLGDWNGEKSCLYWFVGSARRVWSIADKDDWWEPLSEIAIVPIILTDFGVLDDLKLAPYIKLSPHAKLSPREVFPSRVIIERTLLCGE
jgi:hypothetical protein